MGVTFFVYLVAADVVFNDSQLLKSTWSELSVAVKSVWDSAIYPIVATIAGALGFDNEIVEAYQSESIGLFQEEFKDPLAKLLINAVLEEAELSKAVEEWSKSTPRHTINKFKAFTLSSEYPTSPPTVKSSGSVLDKDGVQATIETLEGVAVTMQSSYIKLLCQSFYDEYWLQENYGKAVNSFEIVLLGISYTIVSKVLSSNSYIVNLVDSATGLTQTVLPTNIPVFSTGLHFLASYYPSNAPTVLKYWVYKAGSGTYPSLDNATPLVSSQEVFNVYPPIPLRVANVNYNSASTSTKALAIDKSLGYLDLYPEDLLSAILTETNEQAVDNIYIDFTVDVLRNDSITSQYMFNMLVDLELKQTPAQELIDDYNTKYASYLSSGRTTIMYLSDEGRVKDSIRVTTDEAYDVAFGYTYISKKEYTKAEVDQYPLSKEYAAYYNDPSKVGKEYFTTRLNDRFENYTVLPIGTTVAVTDPISVVSVSTVANSYSAGYAKNVVRVPTQDITARMDQLAISGFIYSVTLPEVITLKAGKYYSLVLDHTVYQGGGTAIATNYYRLAEDFKYSLNYYRVLPNRIVHIEVFNPVSITRVTDGDTGKFKACTSTFREITKSALTDSPLKDELRVPLLEQYLLLLSIRNQQELFIKSVNVRIMAAQVQIIPWYKTEVFGKIIQAAGLIWAIYSSDSSLYEFSKKVIIALLIKEVMVFAVEEYDLSPEESIALGLGLSYLGGQFDNTATFDNNLMVVSSISQSVNVYVSKEYDLLSKEEEVFYKGTDELKKELKEANDLLQENDGTPLNMLFYYNRVMTTNMTPEQYISSSNYPELNIVPVNYADTFIRGSLDLNRLQFNNLNEFVL